MRTSEQIEAQPQTGFLNDEGCLLSEGGAVQLTDSEHGAPTGARESNTHPNICSGIVTTGKKHLQMSISACCFCKKGLLTITRFTVHSLLVKPTPETRDLR